MPKWWGWITPAIITLTVLSLIPLALIYYARSVRSPEPRVSVIPDMDNQPKYRTQAANPLFADQRAMRPPVEGTVARGMLAASDQLNLGITDGAWASGFPAEIEFSAALLERGQERFDIFCATCHGLDGYGNGMVSQRAEELAEGTWIAPLSYHTPTVRERPVGHLYNTITNGIRSMPAYGTQISVKDRWAIVAYVRALQLSQFATLDDVPAAQRESLVRQAAAEQALEADVTDQPAAAEPAAEEPDTGGGE